MQTLSLVRGFGADGDATTPDVPAPDVPDFSLDSVRAKYAQFADEHPGIVVANRILRTAGMVSGLYHGYKRNDSVGWALGWGLLGSMFPIITTTVAVAQGYGRHK